MPLEDEFQGRLGLQGFKSLLSSDLLPLAPLKQPKVGAFSGSQKKLLHAALAVKVCSIVSVLIGLPARGKSLPLSLT